MAKTLFLLAMAVECEADRFSRKTRAFSHNEAGLFTIKGKVLVHNYLHCS